MDEPRDERQGALARQDCDLEPEGCQVTMYERDKALEAQADARPRWRLPHDPAYEQAALHV